MVDENNLNNKTEEIYTIYYKNYKDKLKSIYLEKYELLIVVVVLIIAFYVTFIITNFNFLFTMCLFIFFIILIVGRLLGVYLIIKSPKIKMAIYNTEVHFPTYFNFDSFISIKYEQIINYNISNNTLIINYEPLSKFYLKNFSQEELQKIEKILKSKGVKKLENTQNQN